MLRETRLTYLINFESIFDDSSSRSHLRSLRNSYSIFHANSFAFGTKQKTSIFSVSFQYLFSIFSVTHRSEWDHRTVVVDIGTSTEPVSFQYLLLDACILSIFSVSLALGFGVGHVFFGSRSVSWTSAFRQCQYLSSICCIVRVSFPVSSLSFEYLDAYV